MSTLSEIQTLLTPELRQLNELIASTLASPNELMNSIVGNYLQTKGKQIRPILVILSAKLFGKVNDATISAAAAVELLHNASLIHDDVVDETKTRRGRPTINGVWDNHIAVLVGDFFVSAALTKSIATADLRIIQSLAKLGRLLSIGELDQIYCARNHQLDEQAYMLTIERKTASLFMSCVEMGGYSAGASDDDIARIAEFARLLGLCFQIRDDIFDYFADDSIGKPTGNDLREGKITLPLLHALLTDTSDLNAEMRSLAATDTLTTPNIDRLIDYAKSCGGIDHAYAVMASLRDRAFEVIKPFETDTTDIADGDIVTPASSSTADAACDRAQVIALLKRLFDYTIERRF